MLLRRRRLPQIRAAPGRAATPARAQEERVAGAAALQRLERENRQLTRHFDAVRAPCAGGGCLQPYRTTQRAVHERCLRCTHIHHGGPRSAAAAARGERGAAHSRSVPRLTQPPPHRSSPPTQPSTQQCTPNTHTRATPALAATTPQLKDLHLQLAAAHAKLQSAHDALRTDKVRGPRPTGAPIGAPAAPR